MIVLLRKRLLICLSCLLALLLLWSVLLLPSATAPVFSASEKEKTVVIDPGHGGEDGGAIALDGTEESAINLAVARRLREVLFLLGVPSVMTREEDLSLSTNPSASLLERKRSDLVNRVKLINAVPSAVLLSIHQNSLPNYFSVHGAQAFYNGAEGSDTLAESIQSTLNLTVNTDREKQKKKIDSSIYLMRHVSCTAVLVECGFLTNAAETKKLKTDAYQTVLALAIASGFCNWKV